MRQRELRQVLLASARFRFFGKGYTEGNDVYAAFGQSFGGRYLVVFFVYKPNTITAIVISARDMTDIEADLLASVERQAQLRGVSVETLVNSLAATETC